MRIYRKNYITYLHPFSTKNEARELVKIQKPLDYDVTLWFIMILRGEDMYIKEFAKLTGVSVRTLHYYDEIGLLSPASVDGQNRYRDYDEQSLGRMAEILFYRELDFPLSSIKSILSSPDYDKADAFRKQKELLTLKKERLEALISALEQAEKGVISMNTFNNNEYERARKQYADEAKQRWGATDAYKEYEQKAAEYSDEKKTDAADGMNAILAEFAAARAEGATPDSETAQTLVRRLQAHITDNFYTCTKEILAGLGQMYVADERFKANIDKNGNGTAEFISKAVKSYCR